VNQYFSRNPDCGTHVIDKEKGTTREGCVSLGYRFGGVKWDVGVNTYSKASHARDRSAGKLKWEGTKPSNRDTVLGDLELGRPVIIHTHDFSHWVVATGYDGENDTLYINDAGDDDPLRLSHYNNKVDGVRRYRETNTDYSLLSFAVSAPGGLLLTDPDGKQTGLNPEAAIVEEIPDSGYYFERAYEDLTGGLPPPPDDEGINALYVNLPKAGTYSLRVVAPEGFSFGVAADALNRQGDSVFDLIEAPVDPPTAQIYEFSYDPEAPEAELFQLDVPLVIKPGSSTSPVQLAARGVIPVAILTTPTFDASVVDPASLGFGPARVAEEHGKGHFEDVDGDGDTDLVLHFRLQSSGLLRDSTEACVQGSMKQGIGVKGCASVRIL
jgi:hypothetical protein